MSTRVVLFGLDGATDAVLDDLVRRGVMPFLGEFIAAGARGMLRSTIPPLTPPAWTTMVTGRSPGGHGIFNFLQYQSETSAHLRIVSSREVSCETIWSMVARQGKRAGSLNFVAHSPAWRINGYIIPGWVPWRWVKKHSHPPDLIDKLKSDLPDFDLQELAMNFKEEEKAVAGAEIQDFESWIDLHIRRERQWFNILRHQMKNDPTELTGIVFDGVDKIQHLLWRFLDPTLEPHNPSEEFRRTRERCWDYFRQIDEFLKETVQLVGPNTHVWIVSDHGFCATTEIVYINSWLEQQGYLTWAPTADVEPEDSQRLGDAHPYHLTHMDLSQTRAYATSASNNGIHIAVDGVRGKGGLKAEQYQAFRDELINALLTRCVDPATGRPLVTRVWTREEVFAGSRMGFAPDLTISLRDNGFFSVLRSDTVLKPRPVVMGCHHPQGVFIASGPDVRRGVALEPTRMIDITPTALHALGISIPADLEGAVVTDIFTSHYIKQNPVKTGPPTQGPMDKPAAEVQAYEDQESEAQVLMRLKALGYIE